METFDIYKYIIEEEASYKTTSVPVTGSKEWNMHEHVERCTNVANGWYHSGKNDGNRPYSDLVSPILNVAFRSEGFDVKDIIPFVNNSDNYHKSFLIKKYHPQWARKYEIDTFIDELVESSIIYDLALVKNVNNIRPVVVPLQSIAFCDQTDVLSGPICLKHNYSISDLLEFRGKWNDDKIDEAITMAEASKVVSMANDQEAKTPGKYIEVYELHGMFKDSWLDDGGSDDDYSPQIHIVTFYTNDKGKKCGITLFKGKEKKPIFKALVLKPIFGRACGKSIVESLFEPQVWNNYSAIRIKEMLDAAALNLFYSDDDDIANQKLTNLKTNTVLKLNQGKQLGKVDTSPRDITSFTNHQIKLENEARTLGSASEASLGKNPNAGTPFALQNLIVQEGNGIHEYRQGKIASFVADQLYRDWILGYLVREMNNGKTFSEELSLDEMQEVSERLVENEVNDKIKEAFLKGKITTAEERDAMKTLLKDDFKKNGSRRFFEVVKGELKDLPIEVFVNITGKQKNMVKNADNLTKVITFAIANAQAIQAIPGVGKAVNELLEESGMSAIDFTQITKPVAQPVQEVSPAANVDAAEEVTV